MFLDHDLYLETKELVLGKRKRNPLLVEFIEWMRERFKVEVLNFEFDKLGGASKRYRLYIIVESSKDYSRFSRDLHRRATFHTNPPYIREIENKFRELTKKHRFTSATKYRLINQHQLDDIFITFNNFEEEALSKVRSNASREVQKLIKSYPFIWQGESTNIFFYTDADIEIYESNGFSKQLEDRIFVILKKYDQLGYLTREKSKISYRSKEYIDTKFDGKMYRFYHDGPAEFDEEIERKRQEREKEKRYWDGQAENFDDEPDHGLIDPQVRNEWVKLFTKWLPDKNLSILDIGCGTGSLSLLLAELGNQVIGIDFSPAMIEKAKEKVEAKGVSVEFEVKDARYAAFNGETFDVIVSRHLLWALEEPHEILRNWFFMLNPGGRMILVEGFWGTGIHMEELIEMLPEELTVTASYSLSDNDLLWGKSVADERYIVVADYS